MSSTITLDTGSDGSKVAGAVKVRYGSGNLGTYASNGVAVTTTQFGFALKISDLDARNAAGIVFEWDKTNSKVKAFRQKDPGAVGGADIALPEVANGVDLSAVTFRFRAEGL